MAAKAGVQHLVLRATALLPTRGGAATYLIAIVLIALALAIRLVMAPIDTGLQYVTFFPAVTLAAVVGGFGPGLLATLVGALLATFIFTPPHYSFSVLNLETAFWSNIVFCVDGLVVCSAIEAMYRYQAKYLAELADVRLNSARIVAVNQALKESEAFSLSIFDSRSEQVAVLDEQGDIIAVNEAWRRFASENGASALIEKSIGLNYLEACRAAASQPEAAELPAVVSGIQAVLGGMMSEFELEYPCHSPAQERWFSMRVTPLQGSRCGAVIAHQEISQRKALEKVLMHHAAIVESSEDAIVGNSLNGLVTSWNKGAEQIFGYSREEVLGLHISFLIPETYWSEETRIFEGVRRGIGRKHYQTVRRKKSGELIDVSVTISPMRDAAGHVVGASNVARDITEQKRIEQELRIAATAFEAQEGMIVTDADNIILRVNRAFTLSSGYAAEEAIGQHVRLLKSGRHPAGFYAEMWQTIARDGAWQGEIWNRRKNGEVYPEWLTITVVRNPAGETTHYVGTHTDITARKAVEDEIRNLAFYDPLTRLPNRRLLLDRLHQALSTASRMEREGALMFIDLDNFKMINDSLGHEVGDLLLQLVAQRLLASVREGDTVARLGGDEFVVVLELLSEDRREAVLQAEQVGAKILVALNESYPLAGQQLRSTPSIGITLFGRRECSVDGLLREADSAMYQAKMDGRNALRFYPSGASSGT